MALLHEHIEGKYEILEKLKEGGMGAIYKVRHRLLDEVRVIKVIRAQLEPTEEIGDASCARPRPPSACATRTSRSSTTSPSTTTATRSSSWSSSTGITLQELLQAIGPPPLALCPGGRPPVAAGARLPAPQEDRPPRHLARQPHAHPGRGRRRRGQADRPRHRQGVRLQCRRNRRAHHGRHLPRQAALRLARAVQRQQGRWTRAATSTPSESCSTSC